MEEKEKEEEEKDEIGQDMREKWGYGVIGSKQRIKNKQKILRKKV